MYIAVMKNQDHPLIADFADTIEAMVHYNSDDHDAIEITPTWPPSHPAFRSGDYVRDKAWFWDTTSNSFVKPANHKGKLGRTEMLALERVGMGTRVWCTDYNCEFLWTGNTWQCADTLEGKNNSGATIYEGDCLVPSGSLQDGYSTTTSMYHPSIVGTTVIGNVQGGFITVAVSGLWQQYVYGTLSVGEHLVSYNQNGDAYGVGGPPASVSGQFATAKEAKGSSPVALVKVQLCIMAHY